MDIYLIFLFLGVTLAYYFIYKNIKSLPKKARLSIYFYIIISTASLSYRAYKEGQLKGAIRIMEHIEEIINTPKKEKEEPKTYNV